MTAARIVNKGRKKRPYPRFAAPSGTIRTYRHFFISTFVLRFVFPYPCLVVPHQTGSACIGVPEKTKVFWGDFGVPEKTKVFWGDFGVPEKTRFFWGVFANPAGSFSP